MLRGGGVSLTSGSTPLFVRTGINIPYLLCLVSGTRYIYMLCVYYCMFVWAPKEYTTRVLPYTFRELLRNTPGMAALVPHKTWRQCRDFVGGIVLPCVFDP